MKQSGEVAGVIEYNINSSLVKVSDIIFINYRKEAQLHYVELWWQSPQKPKHTQYKVVIFGT